MVSKRRTEYSPILEFRRSRASVVERVLRMYGIIGSAAAVAGLGYFVLTKLVTVLTVGDMIALLVGGTGIALAVLSRVYVQMQSHRDRDRTNRLKEYTLLVDLLDAWQKFEATAVWVADGLGSSSGSGALDFRQAALISQLFDSELITLAEMRILEEIQEIRDSVAHDHASLSAEVAAEALNVLARITDTLSAYEEQPPN